MKGGARARSGPAPDPDALRRERDGDQWVPLPPEGRQGEPPAWPLDGHSDREAVLWAVEWRRPQAVMWERNGQELEVALYVRSVVAAEQPDAPTNARTLVRQQQEALGLSLPGLARNRWFIADGAPQAPAAGAGGGDGRGPASGGSARDRFRVLNGGG